MKKFKEFFILCAARIFVGVLSLVGLIVPVRIGRLHYERGHLLLNTEFWLRAESKSARGFNLFISGTKPFNRQILTMFKRKILIWENDFAIKIIDVLQRRTLDSKIWILLKDSGHFRSKEWNSVPPQIALNEQEMKKGKELLKRMGINEVDKYVCFHARDDKYLDQFVQAPTSEGWGYQSYRDSHIENYLPAAQELISQGYLALRMGAATAYPLKETENGRLIDYSNLFRSDFMDVFLLSTCRFFFGDSAGVGTFPTLFNTPWVLVNAVPLAYGARNKNALFIPKKHKDMKSGKVLPFREIYERKMDMFFHTNQFINAGVELIENSSQEISDIVREMHLRLEGQWVSTKEDDLLLERYRNTIPDGHPFKGFASRVGAEFLRNNQDLLN